MSDFDLAKYQDPLEIQRVLHSASTIAVVGLSKNELRASNFVGYYLRRHGYTVIPVNPRETEIEGLPCYPTVIAAVEATGPVDIVDVFRRPDLCAEHAREAVQVGARCLWLQLGIANAEAARIAHAAGLSVVMDRCTIIEHRRLAASR